MSEKSPLFSVVMPVFNAEGTLRSALASVLTQTCDDLEFLVVDDGSTDGSGAIAKEVAETDKRVRVLTQANGGTAAAQNAAFAQVRGQYIALHDSDDLWAPEKLARHLAHFRRVPNLGVSYSFSQFLAPDGSPLPYFQTATLGPVDAGTMLCRYPIGNGSNAVLRREALNELLATGVVVDPTMKRSHDIEMWTRLALRTRYSIEGIGEVLTYYRLSRGSYSADLEAKRRDFEFLLKAVGAYAPELIARQGKRARAYHLRYLARRAISLGYESEGARYARNAFAESPDLLWRDPFRSVQTFVAAHLLWLAPAPLRSFLRRVAKLR